MIVRQSEKGKITFHKKRLTSHRKTKNTQNGHILARKLIVKILETYGKYLDNGLEGA